MDSKIALSYKDINLTPNKCIVNTRGECNTEYQVGKHVFQIPVIPSNMPPVVDFFTYKEYVSYNVMPIIHRFGIDPINFLKMMDCWRAVTIGTQHKYYKQVEDMKHLPQHQRPHCICVDVAHGHSTSMMLMLRELKKCFPDRENITIIAGNVTTPEAVVDLQEWGADMIKVGIGPGHVCSTRNKTGFHVPMFTAVKECAAVSKVPIIADGGIRENGDIVKALVAGASMVMAGSVFAACLNSPADTVQGKKEYYGSASIRNKNEHKNIEGVTTHLSPTMTIEEKIREIKQDLQSAISYAGGNDLSALDLSKVSYTKTK